MRTRRDVREMVAELERHPDENLVVELDGRPRVVVMSWSEYQRILGLVDEIAAMVKKRSDQ